MGGFSGVPKEEKTTIHQKSITAHKIEIPKSASQRNYKPQTHPDASRTSRDQDVRVAKVPFEGWQREKENRVKTAFHRILERDWYDKYEQNLSDAELIHINAVREHYAMRRDKAMTPSLNCDKGSNTFTPLEWCSNMEAVEALNRGTDIKAHFRGMIHKRARRRQREEGHQVPFHLFQGIQQPQRPPMQY